MQSPHWPQWKKAIDREFKKLEERKVWGPLQPLPKGKRAHSGRLVFKRKSPAVLPPEVSHAGEATKTKVEALFKLRAVLRGFSQIKGIDYHETFSPTLNAKSLRILVALGASLRVKIRHYDVTSAFTEADIDVELYIEQFEGFKDLDPKKANWVRRLYKGLYGAKQASRGFYLKTRGDLMSLGFKTSALDPCVYILERTGRRPVLVGLFVDDFFLLCDDDTLRDKLFKSMNKYFELQDLGWLRDCLGIRFTQDIENGVTKMDQVDYIKEKILGEHQFDKCHHPVATPFYGLCCPLMSRLRMMTR